MTNLLIGSRALVFAAPTFRCNPGADWDVVSGISVDGCEWHDVALLNNVDMAQYMTTTKVGLAHGATALVVNGIGLSLIKRSHLHRDIGFDKHITMYHKHLKQFEEQWTDSDRTFLNERIRLTDIAFPQQGPNLNQSRDDFFDDAVTKKYDHDYLHELVAFNQTPMYSYTNL